MGTTTLQILGSFIEQLPKQGEYLTLGFSPSYAPLKRRWENNGISADFIADYFQNFYISRQEDLGGETDAIAVANLHNAVKYIANELLENAMKFQDVHMVFTAHIFLSLYTDRLIFSVTNGVSPYHAENLRKYIQVLLNQDPQDLYLQAMRASGLNASQSGLGLLSMICDYSAKLGWKFALVDTDHGKPVMTVTTMVILDT